MLGNAHRAQRVSDGGSLRRRRQPRRRDVRLLVRVSNRDDLLGHLVRRPRLQQVPGRSARYGGARQSGEEDHVGRHRPTRWATCPATSSSRRSATAPSRWRTVRAARRTTTRTPATSPSARSTRSPRRGCASRRIRRTVTVGPVTATRADRISSVPARRRRHRRGDDQHRGHAVPVDERRLPSRHGIGSKLPRAVR